MHVQEWRTVGVHSIAPQRARRQARAAEAVAHRGEPRPIADPLERIAKAPRTQDPRRVRRQHDARADFTEDRRLFMEPDTEALAQQAQGRAQATDAGADQCYIRCG